MLGSQTAVSETTPEPGLEIGQGKVKCSEVFYGFKVIWIFFFFLDLVQYRFKVIWIFFFFFRFSADFFAWKIPWMEEPGVLQSMGSLRVGND